MPRIPASLEDLSDRILLVSDHESILPHLQKVFFECLGFGKLFLQVIEIKGEMQIYFVAACEYHSNDFLDRNIFDAFGHFDSDLLFEIILLPHSKVICFVDLELFRWQRRDNLTECAECLVREFEVDLMSH